MKNSHFVKISLPVKAKVFLSGLKIEKEKTYSNESFSSSPRFFIIMRGRGGF